MKKIVLKSVKDVFSAVDAVLGTEDAGRIIGTNPKGDKTYQIDKVAEKVYLDNMPENVTIISEESKPKLGNDLIVFLDPVCGSILAKRGSKHFTTGISIYSSQLEPICEAIGNFETGDIYYADSSGSYKNIKKIHVSGKKKLDDSTIINCESHSIADRLEIIKIDLFKKAPHVFCPGANKLSLSMLSEGIIDGYVNPAKVYPSTELIGIYLVKQAGGIVSDTKGRQIKVYPNLKHKTSLLCSCTKEMHAALLKML
jgi:myo-inositol-1(or 4)-monophosphatase